MEQSKEHKNNPTHIFSGFLKVKSNSMEEGQLAEEIALKYQLDILRHNKGNST